MQINRRAFLQTGIGGGALATPSICPKARWPEEISTHNAYGSKQ